MIGYKTFDEYLNRRYCLHHPGIQAHPSKISKTFVSHCVSEITGLLLGAHWRHVKLADNPADLAI